MDFKVVAKTEENVETKYAETDSRNALQKDSEQVTAGSSTDAPKLIRKDGVYYIKYVDEMIEIAEWEAIEVYNHPDKVFDVIISHRRKFYFNTAEDSVASLANGGYTLMGN